MPVTPQDAIRYKKLKLAGAKIEAATKELRKKILDILNTENLDGQIAGNIVLKVTRKKNPKTKINEEMMVAMLKERGLVEAIIVTETYDRELVNQYLEEGTLTPVDIRNITDFYPEIEQLDWSDYEE